MALAWTWLADHTPSLSEASLKQSGRGSPGRRRESFAKAKAEATRALQMSEEMGYHWGKMDAEEVLKEIAGREYRPFAGGFGEVTPPRPPQIQQIWGAC